MFFVFPDALNPHEREFGNSGALRDNMLEVVGLYWTFVGLYLTFVGLCLTGQIPFVSHSLPVVAVAVQGRLVAAAGLCWEQTQQENLEDNLIFSWVQSSFYKQKRDCEGRGDLTIKYQMPQTIPEFCLCWGFSGMGDAVTPHP